MSNYLFDFTFCLCTFHTNLVAFVGQIGYNLVGFTMA
jgi:hypothetical protein